jgi:cell division protein FtsX
MSTPLARALNLPRTRLFRALGIVAALLACTIALLAAGAGLLQNLYGNWQLQKANSILLYLPPEASPSSLEPLTTTVPTLAGVAAVRQVPATELQQSLADILPPSLAANSLPLPVVAEVTLQRGADRAPILKALAQSFPTAELDDQQTLLGRVAESVRLLQLAALGVGLVLLGLLTLFMALTIRAGLLAQEQVVHLLLQLGATDGALARAITLQTLLPVLVGTALGIGAAALIMVGSTTWPTLAAFHGLGVWGALVLTPLALPLGAALTAWLVSLRLLKAA